MTEVAAVRRRSYLRAAQVVSQDSNAAVERSDVSMDGIAFK
jgi:hypothetical protein